MMLPIDFYFLVDKEMKAIFLVSKEYWRANRHVPLSHCRDWEHVIPEGFKCEGSNMYRYYQKNKLCYTKGIKVMLDSEFQEIHWGEV